MKTVTTLGLTKVMQRFVAALSHISYTLNGVTMTTAEFNTVVEDDLLRVYLYFDDTVVGAVSDVALVDTDADVVAVLEQEFIKPQDKGLYIVFKYRFYEMEVEQV